MSNDIIRWFRYVMNTGNFEEESSECNTCCYECFCFPFGCKQCHCCNSSEHKIEQSKEQQKIWKQIELPDIMGRFRPTEIASEILSNKQITILSSPLIESSIKNDPIDEYKIEMPTMEVISPKTSYSFN